MTRRWEFNKFTGNLKVPRIHLDFASFENAASKINLKLNTSILKKIVKTIFEKKIAKNKWYEISKMHEEKNVFIEIIQSKIVNINSAMKTFFGNSLIGWMWRYYNV